jgi:hypothetical protein
MIEARSIFSRSLFFGSIFCAALLAQPCVSIAQDVAPNAADDAGTHGPPAPPAPTAPPVPPASPAADEGGSAIGEGDASGAGDVAAPEPAKKPKASPAAKPKAKPKSKTTAKKAPPPFKGTVLSPITRIGAEVEVSDKVLEDCRVRTMLPQAIAERTSKVKLTDGIGTQKLELRIVDVHAPRGGFFSGPKWITVEGKLYAGKTLKGSFIAKETSMAGTTGCGMLAKVMNVLAADIVAWLDRPSRNSILGDAR